MLPFYRKVLSCSYLLPKSLATTILISISKILSFRECNINWNHIISNLLELAFSYQDNSYQEIQPGWVFIKLVSFYY